MKKIVNLNEYKESTLAVLGEGDYVILKGIDVNDSFTCNIKSVEPLTLYLDDIVVDKTEIITYKGNQYRVMPFTYRGWIRSLQVGSQYIRNNVLTVIHNIDELQDLAELLDIASSNKLKVLDGVKPATVYNKSLLDEDLDSSSLNRVNFDHKYCDSEHMCLTCKLNVLADYNLWDILAQFCNKTKERKEVLDKAFDSLDDRFELANKLYTNKQLSEDEFKSITEL